MTYNLNGSPVQLQSLTSGPGMSGTSHCVTSSTGRMLATGTYRTCLEWLDKNNAQPLGDVDTLASYAARTAYEQGR